MGFAYGGRVCLARQVMTDVVGNPEEERRADFYQQPWSQEAVSRYFYCKARRLGRGLALQPPSAWTRRFLQPNSLLPPLSDPAAPARVGTVSGGAQHINVSWSRFPPPHSLSPPHNSIKHGLFCVPSPDPPAENRPAPGLAWGSHHSTSITSFRVCLAPPPPSPSSISG